MSSFALANETSKILLQKGDFLSAIIGNQMANNIKDSIFDDTIKIDENTKLLDVLADELEL